MKESRVTEMNRQGRELAEFLSAIEALSPGAKECWQNALQNARSEGFQAGRKDGLRFARGPVDDD